MSATSCDHRLAASADRATRVAKVLGLCIGMSALAGCAVGLGQRSGAPAFAAPAVLATIPSGEGPTLLALSADGTRLYAAANSQLSVVSTADQNVVATVATQPYPAGLALAPDGTRAFLSAIFSVQLLTVDTVMNTVGTPIELFASFARGGFGRIALTPDGKTGYVVNTPNQVIAVVDLVKGQTTSLTMDMQPIDIAVAPDGRRLYVVGCKNFCATGTIEVLDAASQRVTSAIAVGSRPYRIVLSPDGARAYTSNIGSPSVSVVDLASRSATAAITVPVQPTGLAVSRDGTRIYVASQPTGTITVIDAATNVVRTTVKVANDVREVVVTPDGKRLYVSTMRSVLALDARLLSGS